MVVHVNIRQVRWIKAERVAKRPRRKRQRWLFTGLATESGYPRISTVRVSSVVKTEVCRTSKRIPKLRRSKLIWLPE